MRPHFSPLLALSFAMIAMAGCAPPPDPAPQLRAVPGADLQRGLRLMTHYQCGSCHSAAAVFAAGGQMGPPLDGFGRRSYIAGELPNTPQMMQQWLMDPPALVPGTAMPRLGLSAEDARDIAGYLLSLR